MNGLKFDSSEEKAVEMFAINIMKAGEDFILNQWIYPLYLLGVKSAIPDFLEDLKK